MHLLLLLAHLFDEILLVSVCAMWVCTLTKCCSDVFTLVCFRFVDLTLRYCMNRFRLPRLPNAPTASWNYRNEMNNIFFFKFTHRLIFNISFLCKFENIIYMNLFNHMWKMGKKPQRKVFFSVHILICIYE